MEKESFCMNMLDDPIKDDASTAVICLDEDELNAWWNSLDVEQKADAFAQFSLTMYQGVSHIYIETRHDVIPVKGVVGDRQPVADLQSGPHQAARAGCADPDGDCGDISAAEAR
jgi:hypothetical protein